MTHTDPNQEPPLPNLDDIISNVGEWEEAFADLLKSHSAPPIKHVAYEALSSAYMALNKAQQAIELMEDQPCPEQSTGAATSSKPAK